MSLVLSRNTQPARLMVKTDGLVFPTFVRLGNYEIAMRDFWVAAEYVMTNTDLYPDDPRLDFIKMVKSLKKNQGLSERQKTSWENLSRTFTIEGKNGNPHFFR